MPHKSKCMRYKGAGELEVEGEKLNRQLLFKEQSTQSGIMGLLITDTALF